MNTGMFQCSHFFLHLVSEINSKRYDIYVLCNICPNYIPTLCIGNYSWKKNSIVVCLVFIAVKSGNQRTQYFFFFLVGSSTTYVFISVFLVFLIAVIIMNTVLFHCRLPSKHNISYETAQRLNEMNEKRNKHGSIQFEFIYKSYLIVWTYDTAHIWIIEGIFTWALLSCYDYLHWFKARSKQKMLETFLCNFHPGIWIHFMEMIITIFFSVVYSVQWIIKLVWVKAVIRWTYWNSLYSNGATFMFQYLHSEIDFSSIEFYFVFLMSHTFALE